MSAVYVELFEYHQHVNYRISIATDIYERSFQNPSNSLEMGLLEVDTTLTKYRMVFKRLPWSINYDTLHTQHNTVVSLQINHFINKKKFLVALL